MNSKFGEKYLLKCGWKEGDTLGKSGLGITEPIKSKNLSNSLGKDELLNSDPACTEWWVDKYNILASGLNTQNLSDSDSSESESSDSESEDEIATINESLWKLPSDRLFELVLNQ